MSKEIEGTFKARATGQVVLGQSAQKGTPFVELYFRIADSEHAGEDVRWTGYFSDSKCGKGTLAERTISSLQYAGWSGDDVGEFADGELHGLDANDVAIVVEMEEYEDKDGETRRSPRVSWVNKIGGYLSVQNAMKKDDAAAFGDKMRGLVLKLRDKNVAKASDADTDFPHGANAPKATGTGGARKGW